MKHPASVALFLTGGLVWAQAPAASPVTRTLQALDYRQHEGSTHLVFQGTKLVSQARGDGKAEMNRNLVQIRVDFTGLSAPQEVGKEYLTYVLWAISSVGQAVNLGEVPLAKQGAKGSLGTASTLPAFGMIVTAEPYASVTRPSDAVVLESAVPPESTGPLDTQAVEYELLPRGTYTAPASAPDADERAPLDLLEAANAVRLAEIAGAGKYAAERFHKAQDALKQAQDYQSQKPGQKPAIAMARVAADLAEDARVIAIRRIAQEQQEQDRAAAKAREDAARAQADAESKKRAEAEAEALAAKQEAERQKTAAEQARAELDHVREAAQHEQQQAAQAQQAAEADRLRQADLDRLHLRRQLFEELNPILEAHDTARGLVASVSDTLFDSSRHNLTPAAQIRLARLSGILASHPGLKLQVEGHTDNTGAKDYNTQLSQKRADAVRDYLVSVGIVPETISSQGLGDADPVGDNTTSAGRQQNRRVELVISGDLIGTAVAVVQPQAPPATPMETPSQPPAAPPTVQTVAASDASTARATSDAGGNPFSLQDIVNRVGVIADGRLATAISRRGIGFSPTQADYDKLKQAGAGRQVLEAIAAATAGAKR